jgi:hypothetical protein
MALYPLTQPNGKSFYRHIYTVTPNPNPQLPSADTPTNQLMKVHSTHTELVILFTSTSTILHLPPLKYHGGGGCWGSFSDD